MSEDLYDVIIIGGGPAGLTAAQYASRSGLKTVVLDKSKTSGALAYSSSIENYPGIIEPVSGSELLDLFREQALKFGAEYVETQVFGVDLIESVKTVFAAEGSYKGKTVIIATGSMGRKPTIPGEKQFLGKGVSYCATCDAMFFKGQTVCVVGDSEEVLKETGVLARFAKKVFLIAPSKTPSFPADDPSLQHGNVEVLTGTKVTAINGTDLVTGITIQNGEERKIALDGVFIYLHGSRPVVDFLNESVPMSETSCVLTHRSMETSVPGVFAAGDVTCAEARQVVIAAGFGCIAALSAERYIHHKKRVKFDWAKSKA